MRYALPFLTLLLLACSGTSPDSGTASDATAEDDTCWWCVDGGDVQAPDTLDPGNDTGKGNGKGNGNDDKEFIVWAGTINTETGTGEYKFDVQLADRVCHVTYAVNGLEMADDCAGCDVAYTFTLGDSIDANAADLCPEGVNQEGTSRSYGHGTTEGELLKKTDKGWTTVGISIMDTGTMTWTFYDLSQNPAGGGGKGEITLDAACYDACLEKGADEATCKAACIDDAKGGGKGTATLDQACYDVCLEKGDDEATCKAACTDAGDGKDGKGNSNNARTCYNDCIDAGGTAEECKTSCAGETDGKGSRDGGK